MSTWWKWLCAMFNNSKSRQTRVMVQCSACCLLVLYICVKFCENITKIVRVMEQTGVHGRNGYVQCSKGNNSIGRKTKVMVPVFCTWSPGSLQKCEVS